MVIGNLWFQQKGAKGSVVVVLVELSSERSSNELALQVSKVH